MSEISLKKPRVSGPRKAKRAPGEERQRIHKRNNHLNRSLGGDIAINIFLLLVGLFMIFPMVYAVSSSLKPLDELWIFPPRILVRQPTFSNFQELLRLISNSQVPFFRYIFNTVFISVVGTGGHVLIASLCAYALAKHRFPGRNVIFQIIVLALMFSTAVTTIPNYIIMSRLHMVDTYWAIIIPAFATPLGLYLMKQFMEQMVPDVLLEAARIDGCSEWRIFFRIVMPIVKPAWLTLIIFSFQTLWNSGSNILVFSEELKTLNYAMGQILAGGIARAGVGSAAAVVMMIVPVLLFVFAQSNIVQTMAASGMKE